MLALRVSGAGGGRGGKPQAKACSLEPENLAAGFPVAHARKAHPAAPDYGSC